VSRDFARLANKFFVEVEEVDGEKEEKENRRGIVIDNKMELDQDGGEQQIERKEESLVELSQQREQDDELSSNVTISQNQPQDHTSSSDNLISNRHDSLTAHQRRISPNSLAAPHNAHLATSSSASSLCTEHKKWKRIGFRREEENDQSLIIVEDLNILSTLLNEDLEQEEAEKARSDESITTITPQLTGGSSTDEPQLQAPDTHSQLATTTASRQTSCEHSDVMMSMATEPWKRREPLIDIEAFQKRVHTLQDSTPFTSFLQETFDQKTSRTMRLLKCCDQSYVVCLLGHLGMILFSQMKLRFKDIRPSTWKIIVRKHKDTYSVIHRRKERALKIESNIKLVDLFSFEWEVEIVFDSKQLNHIESVHVRMRDVDWSDCQDLMNPEHEQNVRDAFEHGSITDLKCHLEDPPTKSSPSKETKPKSKSSDSLHHKKKQKLFHLFGCMSRHHDERESKRFSSAVETHH